MWHMRHSLKAVAAAGSLLLTAVALVGCASAEDQADRAKYDAMLRVDSVPGVVVASYANWVQVDPAAPEDEIVATLLAVRDILLDTDFDDVTVVAVYPGDPQVNTEFTSRVLEGAQFERDAHTWAGLLDEGFTEVRYNVFDDTGDGVLYVEYKNPDQPGPALSEAFEEMVSALGGSPDSHAGLQTEATIGTMLVTNRTGSLALPAGWPQVVDGISAMDFITHSSAQFNSDRAALALSGTADLTPEQNAAIMKLLTDNGVLQAGVTVAYAPGGDKPAVWLFGTKP